MLVSCSVQDNFNVLSFFFDGVADPNEAQELAADSTGMASDSIAIAKQSQKIALFVHLPYQEKKCEMCHDQGRMGKLTEKEPELCYQCHSDFGTNFKMEHGPVAGGYCTGCHNPHRSSNDHLQIRTGDEQCLHCHESGRLYKDAYHVESLDNQCISCHGPHGTNNHSILKPSACIQCHASEFRQYRVAHGPVVVGECSVCHHQHYKKTEKLLIRPGKEMCFYCHDCKRLLESEIHLGLEDMHCIECHNPHGGDDRYMFNE